MKLKIILIILLLSKCSWAKNYEVSQAGDQDKGYVLTQIKKDGKEIAKFCLIDPEKGFDFFSVESDSDFFKKQEKDYFAFSMKKHGGYPTCIVLADFSWESKINKKINIGYLWNYLGVLLIAPPYLKRADFLNPNKESQRYFMEIRIGRKDYYGILVTNALIDAKEAKRMANESICEKNLEIKTRAILDFPVKLLGFDGKKVKIIYESVKNHKKYTCLFLTGKHETVPK